MSEPLALRRRLGICFHRRVEESRRLAESLVAETEALGAEPRLLDAWESRELLRPKLRDLDWLAVLGGDGTMLRMIGLATPLGLPVLGINFGRLGFLTEIAPADAGDALRQVLAGAGRIEERVALSARSATELEPALDAAGAVREGTPPLLAGSEALAVNDVFIGRGRVAHAVRLEVAVDGRPTLRLTADGLVIASPTGSSAYSLSAGGPILEPRLGCMVLTPVVPHPMPVRSLVLPAAARVVVTLRSEEDAVCSLDGQRHFRLPDGSRIDVGAHARPARFLRLSPPEDFFGHMVARLG